MVLTQRSCLLALLPLLLLLAVLCGEVQCSRLLYSPDLYCNLQLVESVPQNLTHNSSIKHMSTFNAYSWLVKNAKQSINFASLYWSLRGQDVMPNCSHLAAEGEALYQLIAEKGKSTKMTIAFNNGGLQANLSDLIDLNRLSKVDVIGLNFTKLFGDGVLHTKAVISDQLHAYIGSSNMDWRSLTQIQELGMLMTNCPTLAADLNKLLQVYYITGKAGKVPRSWPDSVIGTINATHPWKSVINGYSYLIYFGASPAPLCPPYRSRDIDAIVDTIRQAKQFVHVAVMDYEAAIYSYSKFTSSFWPVIDDELRSAAFRGVKVKLLVSHWKHSDNGVRRFVKSLTILNYNKHVSIEGKFFIVPANEEQRKIPFARVNHNKYLVTESTAVICTSNLEGSYFISTAGIAMVITQLSRPSEKVFAREKSVVAQVQDNFIRDWNSKYAHNDYLPRN